MLRRRTNHRRKRNYTKRRSTKRGGGIFDFFSSNKPISVPESVPKVRTFELNSMQQKLNEVFNRRFEHNSSEIDKFKSDETIAEIELIFNKKTIIKSLKEYVEVNRVNKSIIFKNIDDNDVNNFKSLLIQEFNKASSSKRRGHKENYSSQLREILKTIVDKNIITFMSLTDFNDINNNNTDLSIIYQQIYVNLHVDGSKHPIDEIPMAQQSPGSPGPHSPQSPSSRSSPRDSPRA